MSRGNLDETPARFCDEGPDGPGDAAEGGQPWMTCVPPGADAALVIAEHARHVGASDLPGARQEQLKRPPPSHE